jgi:DNA primase large subunit
MKRLHFTEYLRLKAESGLKGKEWSLTNRCPIGGYVTITDAEHQYLQKAKRPHRPAHKFVPPDRIDARACPPCVSSLVREAVKGTNLTHAGRFLLISFMRGIGADAEELTKLFAHQPDFDPRYTNYQINHIYSREYAVPACEWIKHRGLCPAPCGNTNHPLKYYECELKRVGTSDATD